MEWMECVMCSAGDQERKHLASGETREGNGVLGYLEHGRAAPAAGWHQWTETERNESKSPQHEHSYTSTARAQHNCGTISATAY